MRSGPLLLGLLVGCGGSPASGPPDAAPPVDAAAPDAGPPPGPPMYDVVWIRPTDVPFAAPYGMNAAGEVVGYGGPGAFDPGARPLLVSPAGELTWLPLPEEDMSFAWSIDALGRAAGEAARRPAVWPRGGDAHLLPVPDGHFSGVARGGVPGGIVVGSYADYEDGFPLGPRPCVWTDVDQPPATLPGLPPDSVVGAAWDVNAAGQIAGSSGGIEGAFYAVRWDTPTSPPKKIGPLPGAMNSEALAINGAGDVVGRSSSTTTTEAFLYTAADDALAGLGFLEGGGPYSEAFAVNDARVVVGTASAGEAVVHGVLWQDGVGYDLNALVDSAELAAITSAGAINEEGAIAAEADLPDGRHAIVLLRPRP